MATKSMPILYIQSMEKFFIFFSILLFASCATPQKATEEPEAKTETKRYIPQYAINFADSMKKTYPKSFRGKKFYYDEEENGVVEIFMVNTKNERKKREISRMWKGGNSYIGNREIEFNLTRKKIDEAEQRMEQRRKDTAFAEIEKVIFQVATEYKYDWEKAYGKEVKYRNPNTKKAVCDGYANAVIEAFKNHPLVEKVEKWTGGNHAWNVIILKDGRKIYCDATWYQRQGIDEEGYVLETIYKTPTDLTFDIEEFNTLGGAIDNSTGELLKVHFTWEDAKLAK